MATQSLYRRYRPRRFSELRGQQHVVRALRDSIANDRSGQAYLFSGPRGTGKTTTARIMAKALNCENVVDGEPCCECDSCVAVDNGTSYDVHELDAASNNGVEAIRDLIEKASLGTPGRHKVYILDEVHMLSKGAEAALLKTLEEPPPHVVFVLATTDPQKMSDTIRSRTQHLQFHLLPADELEQHIQWVANDAGYELDASAFATALERGGGSARDTLSALELIASTGGDAGDSTNVDALLQALIDGDTAAALGTTAADVSKGLDPRTMTEDVVRHLRNGFLSLMAPDVVVMAPDRLEALSAQAQTYGAANLVRAIERLGATLTDMRHAPDPRVLLEVALVQLTADLTQSPPTDAAARAQPADSEGLEQRLVRLERQIESIAGTRDEAGRDPATGKKVLGGAARRARAAARQRGDDAPAGPGERSPGGETPTGEAAPNPSPAATPTSETPTAAPPAPAQAPPASAHDVWPTVRAGLKPLVRALYSAGEFRELGPGEVQIVVTTTAQAAKCETYRGEVEQALRDATDQVVNLSVTTANAAPPDAGSSDAPAHATPPATAPPVADDQARQHDNGPDSAPPVADEPLEDETSIDLDELVDAPPESYKSPIDRLAEAFPGSEIMEDEQ